MAHDCAVMTGIFSKNGVSLERLQTLEKVVRSGSIAFAANGDPNAQSQISRQIKELEESLGIELLDRTKKPYQPTESARRLADSCERFVREVEGASAEAGGRLLPITVGAGELVIRELVIPWIGKRKKSAQPSPWIMRNLTGRRIQEGLASERLDVGIASGLEGGGAVKVVDLESYGLKLVLPEGMKPDRSGRKGLAGLRVVVLEGDMGLRRLLADCTRAQGVSLEVGGECTSYPQAVDLAEATGCAVLVPEYWWRGRKDWAARTQALPGLENFRRTLQLGWNANVIKRRPQVAEVVKALGGLK